MIKTLFLVIHFFVTMFFIVGTAFQASRSEGLGSIGGGSEVFRGQKAGGLAAVLDVWMEKLAWIFLFSCLLSAVIVPRFF